MASAAKEELAESVVVVAVQPELAAAACRPSSEATIPMEHGTSSAGPSTCDDPPDSNLSIPFLNAASPILCAPLQDTALPLARASHVWLPAEEQWRQLKPPRKRKQPVERPASGMAVGGETSDLPVSRRGPVADALPPGWVCDEHVSSSGIHYKRYRGPYGQRAQSVRDAWRKVEGEAEAREAGKEAGAAAGAAAGAPPHGGEPPAAPAKATLSLAVRDDGTGRTVVAATVCASARGRKQRCDKGKKRGPRAPTGAAADAPGGAAVDFALGPLPQGALAPGDPAAVAAKAEEKAARRAARRVVAAVLDGLVRQVEREHGPPPAEGVAAAGAAGARSSAASSSEPWSAGRGRVKGSPATAFELFLAERRQELKAREVGLSKAELHTRVVAEWRENKGEAAERRLGLGLGLGLG